MDLNGLTQSERSQKSQKNTNTISSHLYVESKKPNQTNEQNRLTETQNKLVGGQRGGGPGVDKTDEGDEEVQMSSH